MVFVKHMKGPLKEPGLGRSRRPVWTNITVAAAGQASVSGNALVPKTPEAFSYDADGNLTSDSLWTNVWDAENRLISMQSVAGVPAAAKLKVDFAYDQQGRRVQKVVSTWNGSAYVPQYTNRFVYDGWNLVAILNSDFSLFTSFAWGLDLSGTMQGAGGVGGLLWMTVPSGANAGRYFCAYDGNGNVMALVSAADGSVAARYEYGPFGEVIRATGPMAKANPFRFSTKYQDDETDLLYYGYRYYNPSTGRWPNRDPINEFGFILLLNEGTGYDMEQEENLYRFVNGNPISLVDKDGRNPAVIVIGGAAITAAEAAALAASVAAAICAADADCRAAVGQAVSAAITAVGVAAKTVCDTRCRFGNHGPHHDFIMPKWGIPPWKRCYMNHVQVNCWIKGKSGSNFLTLRLPYGPCYKFKNAIPPTTH